MPTSATDHTTLTHATDNITLALTTGPVLAWSTKNGTARSAHTESAQARAPRSARLERADSDTLQSLKNGVYRPFLQDVRSALTRPQSESLSGVVSASLSTLVDGVAMAPIGDVLTTVNKRAVIAFCEYLQNPVVTIKGVAKLTTIPKGKQYLIVLANNYLDYVKSGF